MSTTELEIMPTQELGLVVSENRLSAETAASLQTSFAPLFREARSVLEKSRSITVTDASQKLEIKLARECRLALRKIRTTGDALRKELKDESLRRGRAIDGFQNILLHLTADEETRLEEQEKFVERQETARKAQLKADREKALAPYGLDTPFMSLGEMPDETFRQLLENSRSAHEAKIAAAQKAEADRIAAENVRLREEARIREENARLQREAKEREEAARLAREQAAKEKAEAEAAATKARAEVAAREKAAQETYEAAMRAERDRLNAIAAEERLRLQALAEVERQKTEAARAAAEAEAHRQRVAREQLEAEAKAAREAEAQKQAAEAKAKRKAALAPDREKLMGVAAKLRTLDVPKVASDAAKDVVVELLPRLTRLAAWLEQEAKCL